MVLSKKFEIWVDVISVINIIMILSCSGRRSASYDYFLTNTNEFTDAVDNEQQFETPSAEQ